MSALASLLNRPVASSFSYDCFAPMADINVPTAPRRPEVISEQHDIGRINWAGGLSDPGEMIACGYLPEARRQSGESDTAYQARLLAMDLPGILGPERFAKLLTAAQGRANLAISPDGKVCMFGAGKPWWHELGTRISEATDSRNALELSRLAGWGLIKVPLFATVNGQQVDSGCFAIARSDNGKILTKGKSVGSRYKIYGNEELADFLDAVVDGVNTRYESAGALGNGEKIWFLAKMPGATAEIADGDTVEQYLALTSAHDGSGAICAFRTAHRIVCANSHTNALKDARGRKCVIRHTTNLDAKVKAARETLGLAQKAAQDYTDTARLLGEKPLQNPGQYFQALLDRAVPGEVAETPITYATMDSAELARKIASIGNKEDREEAQEKLERVKKTRCEWLAEIESRYANVRNNGMQSIQGTAWAAVNAVTEAAQHSDLLRYKGTPRERQENRLESMFDGRLAEISDAAVELALKA